MRSVAVNAGVLFGAISAKGSLALSALLRKSHGSDWTPKSASLVTPPSIEKYVARPENPVNANWPEVDEYRKRSSTPSIRPMAWVISWIAAEISELPVNDELIDIDPSSAVALASISPHALRSADGT